MFKKALLLLLAGALWALPSAAVEVRPGKAVTIAFDENAVLTDNSANVDGISCGVVYYTHDDDNTGTDTTFAGVIESSADGQTWATAVTLLDGTSGTLPEGRHLFRINPSAAPATGNVAVTIFRCQEEFTTSSVFGLTGTTGGEKTLSSIYHPTYTFTPGRALRRVYVSCNPLDDNNCGNHGGADDAIASGTTDSGSSTTLVDAALSGVGDDFYNGDTIIVIDQLDPKRDPQEVVITDYTDSTGTVTVAAWPGITPASGSLFVIEDAGVSGGDLRAGNSNYPGNREFPLATIDDVEAHLQCGYAFVFDSKDEWGGATNYNEGFTAAIDPDCPTGWTNDVGILFTVTEPGDHAIWNGEDETGGQNPGVIGVSETTATAWVAAEWIHFYHNNSDGLRIAVDVDGRLAGNNIITETQNRGAVTNAHGVSIQSGQFLCFNCGGSVITGADASGTPLAILQQAKGVVIGQKRWSRIASGFTGQTMAFQDCTDITLIGADVTFTGDDSAGDGDQNNGITLKFHANDAGCATGSTSSFYGARLFIHGHEGAVSDKGGVSIGGAGTNAHTSTIRIYQSRITDLQANAAAFKIQCNFSSATSSAGTYFDILMRGITVDGNATGSRTWDMAENNCRDEARMIVDWQNSVYNDNDATVSWELDAGTTRATYELAAADIPSHWTFLSDSDSFDLTGSLSWDANDTKDDSDDLAFRMCDASEVCHEAMLSDYVVQMAFTVPAFALGGEGTMNSMILSGGGQDIGNE